MAVSGRKHKTMYCIIMGDIVQSKELDSNIKKTVKQTLESTLTRINAKYADSMLAHFGPVRGDAFEGVLLSSGFAPKIIQEIIKSMYRVDKTKVRICVVLDKLDRVDSDRNKSDGPAFHQANYMIEDLKARKSEHWMQVSLETYCQAQPIINSLLNLLSALTEHWTERQTEVAWAMDEHSSQQNLVSRKLNISTSVINKQVKASNYYVYKQAWNDLEEYLTTTEEISKDEIGFSAYYSVARRKAKQQLYDEAIILFLKAVDLAKSELGSQDPVLSIIYNGLAETYLEVKCYEKTADILETSFKIQSRLPKARIEYAKTIALEGNLMVQLNDIDKAICKYNEALQITLDTMGDSHPFVYKCYNSLAIAYWHNGSSELALKNFFLSLEYYKKHFDCDPFAYSDILYNIALCYQSASDKKNALMYAKEALEVRSKYLPSKHKDILKIETSIMKLTEA